MHRSAVVRLAKVYCLLFLFVTPSVSAQNRTEVRLLGLPDVAFQQQLEAGASHVVTAMNLAFGSKTPPQFEAPFATPAGRDVINELWSRAPFRCLRTSLHLRADYIPGEDRYEIRGIPLQVKDGFGAEYHEEGVLIVDRSGKLDGFKFGLEAHRYRALLEDRRDVQEYAHRQKILDFVENYQTAYNRKDISFIDNVFSEHALIIVGRVVQEDESRGDNLFQQLGNERVQFIRRSKLEYLASLRSVFDRNEYIEVDFSEIEIFRHHTREAIYGVNLVQRWRSYSTATEGYRDVGYLFLLIDFSDETKPMVHVRTWQPQSLTAEDEIIDMGFFDLE